MAPIGPTCRVNDDGRIEVSLTERQRFLLRPAPCRPQLTVDPADPATWLLAAGVSELELVPAAALARAPASWKPEDVTIFAIRTSDDSGQLTCALARLQRTPYCQPVSMRDDQWVVFGPEGRPEVLGPRTPGDEPSLIVSEPALASLQTPAGGIVVMMRGNGGWQRRATIASIHQDIDTCPHSPPCPRSCRRDLAYFWGHALVRDTSGGETVTWLVALAQSLHEEHHPTRVRNMMCGEVPGSRCDPAGAFMCEKGPSSPMQARLRIWRLEERGPIELPAMSLDDDRRLADGAFRLSRAVAGGQYINVVFERDREMVVVHLPNGR